MASPENKRSAEQRWLLPVEGRGSQALVADVALAVRTRRLGTFAVPDNLAASLRPGTRVVVPWGRSGRPTEGWCLRTATRPWDQTLRPLLEADPRVEPFTPALADLAEWMAEYYACPPGRVMAAMLPQAAIAGAPRERFLRRTDTAVSGRLSAVQKRVLELLGAGPRTRRSLLVEAGCSAASLRTLIRRGLLDEYRGESAAQEKPATSDTQFVASPEDDFRLSPGQHRAIDSVAGSLGGGFSVFVLFGAPGSGKTEVYVRAARAALAAGRQVLLLVPEIALATQIVERLARRFTRVAVLHSALAPATRRAALRRIAADEVDLVIGTRNAVFAPLPRLGLIVVDEEQESSYKALAQPLFHARDVAIKRAQLEGATVLLGSATPALETWFNAGRTPHFRLLRLDERVGDAQPPGVRVVHWPRGIERPAALSPELIEELRRTLGAGDQALLLHNRRGYATGLRCMTCGMMPRCDRCDSLLIHHRATDVLRCHRCGAVRAAVRHCLDDTCNGPLERAGHAIERLEEELAATLPAVRLQRLDRDTLRGRGAHAAALTAFESGDADVLLGTQMIAKGLDFPRVRLVGVIDADAALRLPDFRARERVFQLLVQVIGRAGRRAGTSVALLQCADPNDPLLARACRLDYEGFAQEEIAQRAALGYPPAGRLARVLFLDARPGRARRAAEQASAALRELAARVAAGLVVGPAEPCVVSRVREMHRWQVLLRAPRDRSIQRLLADREAERAIASGAQRVTIDVDPIDLL